MFFVFVCVDFFHFSFFTKPKTSRNTTLTTQPRPPTQPNTPPHNTEPPNHRTTQPNHPNTRPITPPEGGAGRPREGRDELPPEGRGGLTPDWERRRWRTPCRRRGRGERPTGGVKDANHRRRERAEANHHWRRRCGRATTTQGWDGWEGGAKPPSFGEVEGIHFNVLSLQSKKGNCLAIQRRKRKEAPRKGGGGRQHHQKEEEIAAIGRRHHRPKEEEEEIHLSFLVVLPSFSSLWWEGCFFPLLPWGGADFGWCRFLFFQKKTLIRRIETSQVSWSSVQLPSSPSFGWGWFPVFFWKKKNTGPKRAGGKHNYPKEEKDCSTTQQKRGEKQLHPKDGFGLLLLAAPEIRNSKTKNADRNLKTLLLILITTFESLFKLSKSYRSLGKFFALFFTWKLNSFSVFSFLFFVFCFLFLGALKNSKQKMTKIKTHLINEKIQDMKNQKWNSTHEKTT